jgi:hypothetical protein
MQKAITESSNRCSEAQISLKYAQNVADVVRARRIEELKKRREDLQSLPVTHPVDVELRDDLLRKIQAELKQLIGDP